ncbi:TNF receptor-associated factor 5-like [Orbicella faveolata]|uniref:TNF receptor-associated factor 5-like n=1 Tax=Orbicella faveolata TaxID=48498 RepID=UPI0009E1AB74|nr:TNF receptor-associated factor 5-like [Orbicella faveolata]
MASQESQQKECSCPVDREELDRQKDIFPDKATGRKILSFTIKCSSDCCEWTGELREKEHHLASCSFKIVSCTNEKCQVTIQRKELEEHVTNSCQWRIVVCDHCNKSHPKCVIQDHVEKCEKKPVECPNNCGEIIVQEEIARHTNDSCPLSMVSCPHAQMGCNAKVI